MSLKDNVLNARDMHAVTKVMKTQLIDTRDRKSVV